MRADIFCCPLCKGKLLAIPSGLECGLCGRGFAAENGVLDLFVSESDDDFIDEKNKAWLVPQVVEARDTIYRLCARELRGMTFCMQAIRQRTRAGCHLLEVGMGTGHFTRWLAEASAQGTKIYAFDFSWPIIAKALANTAGVEGVNIFRANARGRLPFRDNAFDIVFIRLAPLGSHGVSNVEAALGLLKPGGWCFSAMWDIPAYETPPMEFAIQVGYASAEHHAWQYERRISEEEYLARQVEGPFLSNLFQGASLDEARKTMAGDSHLPVEPQHLILMTQENILIAQKPYAA
jgi:SAM-dependent methyltransferase